MANLSLIRGGGGQRRLLSLATHLKQTFPTRMASNGLSSHVASPVVISLHRQAKNHQQRESRGFSIASSRLTHPTDTERRKRPHDKGSEWQTPNSVDPKARPNNATKTYLSGWLERARARGMYEEKLAKRLRGPPHWTEQDEEQFKTELASESPWVRRTYELSMKNPHRVPSPEAVRRQAVIISLCICVTLLLTIVYFTTPSIRNLFLDEKNVKRSTDQENDSYAQVREQWRRNQWRRQKEREKASDRGRIQFAATEEELKHTETRDR